MEKIEIQPLDITKAFMTYLFPFSFRVGEHSKLMKQLEENHFHFFSLEKNELQDLYYGEGIKINHKELDQFFLPFIEDKLFPVSTKERGFLRFSKEIKEHFQFDVNNNKLNFEVNSVDIILCPFGVGIVTIRTEMDETQETLTNVLDFMSHFRVLQPKLEEENGGRTIQNNKIFHTTSELVLDYLCNPLKSFIIQNKKMEGYYGSLPFFEDERMLTSTFLIAAENQTITKDQLYRIGQLDGKDSEGQEFMSSTNQAYIERYIEKRVHDRWAPNTYTITSQHTQTTVSIKKQEQLMRQISQFMSTHYYNLLLHYYYKIMFFKLSFEHSDVDWVKDKIFVEELIELISKFDSGYYFNEVSYRTEGKEFTHILRETFNINYLFEEVKRTVDDLFRAQEKQTIKRQNMLLFMLTVYTVISGIYGMNLAIDDWKGKTDWSKVSHYSFFEWISLITALTGIALSGILLASTGGKMIWEKYRKWKRRRFQ
ncbi:hypothetical protein ACFVR1_08190 [Psychrobacillus sp. NPDC058041]|uniref:hypothetical protein n=1 Tax=Psychrobacillus sp. NPDC058041 TaxID=3346310 RepID=UPI0036D7F447